jgi:predicted transcriptional regulator
MVKMTFTLDDETVARLRQSAERLAKPQSAVVREAIADYADRVGRLSERERVRLLEAFDTLVPRIPRRPLAGVDAELREIRAARRAGGRRRRT